MNKFVLAMSVVAVSATGAVAADLPAKAYTKAPAFVEANDWAGFYIGGQVGGDWSNGQYTLNNGAGTIEPFTPSASSALGGGHVGVQGQWANWVLGVEGDYNWTSLRSNDISVALPGSVRSTKIDGIATVEGKVGYAFGKWLMYYKGGWADADMNTFQASVPGTSGGAKKWQSGYTFGGGADYKITQNWIAGVDFDYYHFQFDRTALNAGGTTSTWSGTRDSIYSLTFRLSYLFNWSSPVVARY